MHHMPDDSNSNKQLFYTIDVLDEAIEKKRQVEFEYCSYGTDKQLHPRRNDNGEIRRYIVNPYQLAVMSVGITLSAIMISTTSSPITV